MMVALHFDNTVDRGTAHSGLLAYLAGTTEWNGAVHNYSSTCALPAMRSPHVCSEKRNSYQILWNKSDRESPNGKRKNITQSELCLRTRTHIIVYHFNLSHKSKELSANFGESMCKTYLWTIYWTNTGVLDIKPIFWNVKADIYKKNKQICKFSIFIDILH